MVFDSAAPAGYGTAPGHHEPGERPIGGHEHLHGTVLSVPAGKVIGIMNDTVLAGDPSPQAGQEGTVAGDTGSAGDPGVNVGAPRAVSSFDASNRVRSVR